MKRPFAKLWCVLACSLVVTSGLAARTGQVDQPSPDMAVQSAKQTPAQLQQVVAPIASYPDNLVAQILAAATYPDEIVEADRWLQQHADLKGDQLAKEADKQPWDPAVKASAVSRMNGEPLTVSGEYHEVARQPLYGVSPIREAWRTSTWPRFKCDTSSVTLTRRSGSTRSNSGFKRSCIRRQRSPCSREAIFVSC